MITLRDNQNEPINLAIEYFRENKPKPSLIVLPTAWGKSILTAFVAKAIEDKILVVQPSKELLEQNYRKYLSLCEFETNAGIYSASFNKKEIAQITYATIGSIKSLGAKFKEMGFTKMLIDEAHLYPRESDSMLGTFLLDSGITHVLGITATPIKLQTGRDFHGENFSKLVMLTSRSKKGNFYKKILYVGQVSEMVLKRYWSNLTYESQQFDNSLLIFNSSKSEYTEESVENAYYANLVTEKMLLSLDNNSDRKKILVYVPSVQEAIQLSSIYPNSGFVHGLQNKKEREDVINRFRSGGLRVIFNVRVLSTGFDCPEVDCIILGMSTASLALYYQIIGRATRISPNKEDAKIIDLTGNYERFGKVEDLHFEQGKSGMWRLFGTNGILLTGVPVHLIGDITKTDVEKAENKELPTTMPFGKYKDIKLSEIPKSYKRWCVENLNFNNNKLLKKALQASI